MSFFPRAAQNAVFAGLVAQGATPRALHQQSQRHGTTLPAHQCAGALQTALTTSQLTGLTGNRANRAQHLLDQSAGIQRRPLPLHHSSVPVLRSSGSSFQRSRLHYSRLPLRPRLGRKSRRAIAHRFFRRQLDPQLRQQSSGLLVSRFQPAHRERVPLPVGLRQLQRNSQRARTGGRADRRVREQSRHQYIPAQSDHPPPL